MYVLSIFSVLLVLVGRIFVPVQVTSALLMHNVKPHNYSDWLTFLRPLITAVSVA